MCIVDVQVEVVDKAIGAVAHKSANVRECALVGTRIRSLTATFACVCLLLTFFLIPGISQRRTVLSPVCTFHLCFAVQSLAASSAPGFARRQ
jgi:hypothetical protein